MPTLVAPDLDRDSSITIGELFDRFGPMPLWRIRTDPPPGTATEKDVLRINDREDRLCELIDGILVEKTVGYEESAVAVALSSLLWSFVKARKLGVVTGEGGMLKLVAGLVRIPDVAFVSRKRLPGGKVPRKPIPALVPNLAVEILSVSNTDREMRQKLTDYFDAGVELVWYVDPRKRTVAVFTSADDRTLLKATQTLSGGDVLPGFEVKVRELFSILDDA